MYHLLNGALMKPFITQLMQLAEPVNIQCDFEDGRNLGDKDCNLQLSAEGNDTWNIVDTPSMQGRSLKAYALVMTLTLKPLNCFV